MTNTVQIDIIARDLVSPIINGIRGNFGGLDIALGGFRAGFGLMTGDIMAASQGIQTMIGGVQQLGSALTEAAKMQTKMLADAGGFGAVAGINLKQAKDFQRQMNEVLAQSAANLPGEAQEYIKVANGISATLVESFDMKTPAGMESFKASLKEITERTVFLGNTKGTDASSVLMWTNRFLTSGSFSELRNILAFGQDNPALMDNVASQLKARGVAEDKFRGLNQEIKLDILNKALKATVTPELISEVTGTADAMMASLKDKLFSPLIGRFGMMRKVDGTDGRSVLDAFTDFLKGWGYLGNQVAKIANKLGFSFDPLKPIVDVLDWLTSIGNYAGYLLDFSGIGGLASGMLNYINGTIQSWVQAILNLDVGAIAGWLANGLNKYFQLAVGFLLNTDWANIGRMFGVGVVKAISFVTVALLKFNWWLIPQYLAAGILAVCKFLIGLLFGLIEGLIKEIPTLFTAWWQKWTDTYVSFFRGMYDGLTAIKDAFYGWVEGVKKFANDPLGFTSQAAANVVTPQETTEDKQKAKAHPVEYTLEKTVKDPLTWTPNGGFIRNALEAWRMLNPGAKPTESTSTVPTNSTLTTPPLVPPSTPLVIPNTPQTQTQRQASVFSPTVQVVAQTNADPDQIARTAIAYITSEYNRYVQGQLA